MSQQVFPRGSGDMFTQQPEITFFQSVYAKYHPFYTYYSAFDFDNYLTFNTSAECTISSNSDMIGPAYLQLDLPRVLLSPETTPAPPSPNLDILQKITADLTAFIAPILNTLSSTSDTAIMQTAARQLHAYPPITPLAQRLLQSHGIAPNFVETLYETLVDNLADRDNINLQQIIDDKVDDITRQIQQLYTNLMQNTAKKDDNFFAWVPELGHAIIDMIQVHIDGQLVDTHTGAWQSVYSQLSISQNHRTNYDNLIGNTREMTARSSAAKPAYTLLIPLQFWFCHEMSAAIPAFLLNRKKITITVKLAKLSSVATTSSDLQTDNLTATHDINIKNAKIIVKNILLNQTQKNMFDRDQYMLIQTLNIQQNLITSIPHSVTLPFNDPIKYMIWILQKANWRQCQFSENGADTIHSAEIYINHQKFNNMRADSTYYNSVQPYQYSTMSLANGIYFYTFALKPLAFYPSGALDMSVIAATSIEMTPAPDFLSYRHASEIAQSGAKSTVFSAVYKLIHIRDGEICVM